MLQRLVKHLHLLAIFPNIKNVVNLGWLVLGISVVLTGCSPAKLSESQIDEVEIYTVHLAREATQKTFTDEESVNKYVDFFDGLELQEKSEDIIVSELDGGGWDYVYFKRQGKIVKQYALYGGDLICEEESLINETLKMDVTVDNFKEYAEKLDSHKWYVISDENRAEWQAYIQEIVELSEE